jgi:hypothetical protein
MRVVLSQWAAAVAVSSSGAGAVVDATVAQLVQQL